MVTRRRAFGHSLGPLPTARDERDSLWARREMFGASVLTALGGVALAFCWWGSAGEHTFEDGKAWLMAAIVATALIAAVSGLMLMAGFRRLRAAKDDTFERYLRVSPAVAASYLGPGRAAQPTSEQLAEIGRAR